MFKCSIILFAICLVPIDYHLSVLQFKKAEKTIAYDQFRLAVQYKVAMHTLNLVVVPFELATAFFHELHHVLSFCGRAVGNLLFILISLIVLAEFTDSSNDSD